MDKSTKEALKEIQGQRVFFLVDGSGSMAFISSSNSNETESRLSQALMAAKEIFHEVNVSTYLSPSEKTSPDMDLEQKRVKAFLWGNNSPQELNLRDQSELDKARHGLHSGSDLSPALDMVGNLMDEKHMTRVIILSDGDLFDKKKAKESVEILRALSENIQIDVVCIGSNGRSTDIEDFCTETGINYHFANNGADDVLDVCVYALTGNEIDYSHELENTLKEVSALRQEFEQKTKKLVTLEQNLERVVVAQKRQQNKRAHFKK